MPLGHDDTIEGERRRVRPARSLVARAGARLLAGASLVLALATPALAQRAEPGEAKVLDDGLVVVTSDDPQLSRETAKKLAERVRAAYDFVKDEDHWTDTSVLDAKLAVRVLQTEHMKAKYGKTLHAVSLGPSTFVIGEGFIADPTSDRTLAHELTHLQDRRHLTKVKTKLPHYLNEGRAIENGRAYAKKIGAAPGTYYVKLALKLGKMKVEEFRKILTTDAFLAEKKMASVFDMEAAGFLFVEFLRTKLGGSGLADLETRLSRLVEDVGGGATFEDAFEKAIGTKLADAQAAFLAHIEATEGKPRERLAGTALEALANAKPPKPSPSPEAPESAPSPAPSPATPAPDPRKP